MKCDKRQEQRQKKTPRADGRQQEAGNLFIMVRGSSIRNAPGCGEIVRAKALMKAEVPA